MSETYQGRAAGLGSGSGYSQYQLSQTEAQRAHDSCRQYRFDGQTAQGSSPAIDPRGGHGMAQTRPSTAFQIAPVRTVLTSGHASCRYRCQACSVLEAVADDYDTFIAPIARPRSVLNVQNHPETPYQRRTPAERQATPRRRTDSWIGPSEAATATRNHSRFIPQG